MKINDDGAGNWNWFGTMSVAPNGRIDVVWYDSRNAVARQYDSELFYSFSTDGGVTWSPNEQLSGSFDPHLGWPQQNKLGDYIDMTSDLVGANLTWAATFTEIPWPSLPDGIEDRLADVWEPLIAVADAAGGTWPERARVAAVAHVALLRETGRSLGITLLEDMRAIWGDEDVRPTEWILEQLCDLPEAPWGDLRGKPLDARGLARFLKRYGIKSQTVRVGNRTPKGYTKADLSDAWGRYLAGSP